jgi:nitroreductase
MISLVSGISVQEKGVRILEEIRSRRSVRMFTLDQIEDHTIDQIIAMGT